jgi:hypothetical protein
MPSTNTADGDLETVESPATATTTERHRGPGSQVMARDRVVLPPLGR